MRSSVRWSVGVGAVVFAVTAFALVGDGGRVVRAAEPKATAGTNLGPVPAEGVAVLSINVAKLHDADAMKPLRDALEKGDKAMLKRIEDDYGLALADLDRVTFYWPTAHPDNLISSVVTFVTTRKPLDKAKLLKTWKATTEPNPNGGIGPGIGMFGQFGNLGGQFGIKGGVFICPPPPGGGGFLGKVTDPNRDGKDGDKPKPLDPDAPFYYTGKYGEFSIIPIDDRTLVFAPSSAYVTGPAFVAALLRRKADGPLAEALALASKHDVTFSVSGKGIRDHIKLYREALAIPPVVCPCIPQPPKPVDPKPAEGKDEYTPYEPLAEMDRAVLTSDFGPTTTLTATAHFPTDAAAKKAEPVAKQAFADLAELLTTERKQLADDASEKDWLPVYDFALAGLKGAKVKLDGKTLSATATSDIAADLKTALTALPTKIQEAADRMKTHNNLRQIAMALQNYHDNTANYPKDLVDENGKVLMSWRVELLPYLEGNDLYLKIDRTKPWDDAANKKLWDEMPDVFKIPNRPTKEKGDTYFQAFRTVNWLGKDDPWQVDNHKTLATDITDGTAHTAAVFEMAEPTNWMKPGDNLFDPKKLAAIGNPKTGKANVVMLDQTVRVLDTKKYTGDKLAAIITGNGGEEVDPDDFK